MWDFSGDEFLFFWAAAAVALVGTVRVGLMLIRTAPLRPNARPKLALAAVVATCLVGLWVVLRNWADPASVAGHFDYEVLFFFGGIAWLFLTARLGFPLLGLSVRDDAIERQNPAATVAACGGMIGVMLAYAQCNIGGGPTIWTTLIPAIVATVALFAVWAIAEFAGGGISENVTIDRDVASGVRLATLLVSAGAVLGRAMAGDWTGWADTFADFARLGWPVVAIAAGAAVVHRVCRPTPRRPRPGVFAFGVVPSAVLLAATGLYLLALGAPHVAPAPRVAGTP
jgi:uncharacterized membrane protein YjfL (UPF0719 family)